MGTHEWGVAEPAASLAFLLMHDLQPGAQHTARDWQRQMGEF